VDAGLMKRDLSNHRVSRSMLDDKILDSVEAGFISKSYIFLFFI